MIKILIISLSFLMLLHNIGFYIAIHYCGGKVADINMGIVVKKGTCGMENDEKPCNHADHQFKKYCCCDKLYQSKLKDNYKRTYLADFKIVNITILAVIHIIYQAFNSYSPASLILHNHSPPVLPPNFILILYQVFRL